jgi:hypothetical protein
LKRTDPGDKPVPNLCSVSTHWRWSVVKMRRSPEGQQGSGPQAHRWKLLGRRDWRKPLQVTIRYCGGAEPWVEVTARGQTKRYPGYTALLDVLTEVNGRSTF